MMEIFDVSYNKLSDKRSMELFSLRKSVFKDRLDWAVNCFNGMEFDEYDHPNTTYLLGVHDNTVICSLRLINIKNPNMITGTFYRYFNQINIPEGNYIESSRFFVDKERVQNMSCNQYPVSTMLFLAALNYSRKFDYEGILTIVSHAMFIIMKRSGWHLTVLEKGLSEKNEKVYLLCLPVDTENQNILINCINRKKILLKNKEWPLSFTLTEPV
ncbi:N-acyl-L-homoserine lactone synthetase invovled in quorum sensing [Candidatus Regiella insecticola LSR1]|uniref:Acyl-homoserine-lactone synthase n=1 Tax=Candidatus Regiella insecticola LSR1 TaxID=663321 RepID=E0WRX7_9ENTR|nr:acyl-homoserine-lactone synthase [Candidatus Regiella insecticola]EFL92111.1 N-acyl-L-homoserine lactone synthetase invovled in quorum sensing [Candidatus Regiella insecticola LSR1]